MTNQTKKILKLFGFNTALVVIIILLYSPGLVGLALSMATPLKSAITMFATLVLGFVGIKENLFLLNDSPENRQTRILKTSPADFDACEALLKRLEPKLFSQEIDDMLMLVKRMRKKTRTARDILLQYFKPTETSYINFDDAITGVSSLFNDNVREMANRISIFDNDEYLMLKKEGQDLSAKRKQIDYIRTQTAENEAIIRKMDELLMQVSDLLDSDTDIEALPAMQNLEDLIKYTKYYKQK